ncbi:MAG: formate dehydrogenase subunit alpha [Hyphomicrobiales bacterium]|nr:MAG: formate dehydrogenase subunit alpha [Hyphomicrobiales bacterium]
MTASDNTPKATVTFTLDGREVTAGADETIWQVAKREGIGIPHLCHKDSPGYRSDGNCRACMVDIEGERTLAASCVRAPSEGMVVSTTSERATKAREMVFELLLADQPAEADAHDAASPFWVWVERMGIAKTSRFAGHSAPTTDASHPAMTVNLDACIACNLCMRACREVQVNDVIGMGYRGHHHAPVFDLSDPMGASSCVGCGECVAACPTGALMPKSIVDADSQAGTRGSDSQIDSVCPYCGVGCQLTYHVRDGRIAYVEGRNGPANENRLCVKGRFGFDYVHSPQRLTKPLIRKPDAPKGLNVDPSNPLTHFREATWEEALDFAASGLAKAKAEYGPEALAGFGSAKCSNEEAYLFQKLVRTGFATNNVDHCTRLCHASSVAALMEGIGSGAVTAAFTECLSSDVIIVIGSNPTENHPVAATYFKQAAKAGAQLIVMDPRGHALKRHATHMLRFRPGSDVALLNAMLNVIVTEELTDSQYIAAQTENFEAIAANVAAYTPERMAPICGIDAETIRTVARTYARAELAIVFWGMGVSQHTHGTDNVRCLIALAMTTGQIGRPGTGLHPLRGQNNVQGASDAGLIPMFLPDYSSVKDPAVRDRFEALWAMPLAPDPGMTVVEIVNAAYDGAIKAMYIMGENPAMSDPDVEHARAGLARLDHLVVQDIFLTETAMFADVVLPATAWPEKNGTASNTNRQVQMGRKAIDAPGEAREDWAIVQELANRLGLGWSYSHPREVFAEMKQAMPSLDNITWERLEAESAIAYPCPAPDHPGLSIVFSEGFPTASGRAKLVPAQVTDPAELPDDEFPMVLTTGRQLEHWHTGAMTRRAGVLDALEPGPTVALNPATLDRLGLAAGDPVRVTTRRGSITLAARADSAMQDDMMFIPFAYVEAAANILTNPQLDPFGKIPEFKYCAAKVEAAPPGEAAE